MTIKNSPSKGSFFCKKKGIEDIDSHTAKSIVFAGWRANTYIDVSVVVVKQTRIPGSSNRTNEVVYRDDEAGSRADVYQTYEIPLDIEVGENQVLAVLINGRYSGTTQRYIYTDILYNYTN